MSFGSRNYCQHFLGQETGLENSEIEDPSMRSGKWISGWLSLGNQLGKEEVGFSSNMQEQNRG